MLPGEEEAVAVDLDESKEEGNLAIRRMDKQLEWYLSTVNEEALEELVRGYLYKVVHACLQRKGSAYSFSKRIQSSGAYRKRSRIKVPLGIQKLMK